MNSINATLLFALITSVLQTKRTVFVRRSADKRVGNLDDARSAASLQVPRIRHFRHRVARQSASLVG